MNKKLVLFAAALAFAGCAIAAPGRGHAPGPHITDGITATIIGLRRHPHHRRLHRHRMAISGGKPKPPISAMPVGGCFVLRYSHTGS